MTPILSLEDAILNAINAKGALSGARSDQADAESRQSAAEQAKLNADRAAADAVANTNAKITAANSALDDLIAAATAAKIPEGPQ